jgi:hypothetical protein
MHGLAWRDQRDEHEIDRMLMILRWTQSGCAGGGGRGRGVTYWTWYAVEVLKYLYTQSARGRRLRELQTRTSRAWEVYPSCVADVERKPPALRSSLILGTIASGIEIPRTRTNSRSAGTLYTSPPETICMAAEHQ